MVERIALDRLAAGVADQTLDNYAALLREMGRNDEAKKLEARAQAIRAKHAAKNPPK